MNAVVDTNSRPDYKVADISLAEWGHKEIRIAETEKYPHVTFFFSGGREKPFDGESRILCPSPKVATYDLKPEMSAEGVADKVIEGLESGDYGFILVNFANGDMVGHTGDFEAAKIGMESVDLMLGRLLAICLISPT